MRIVVASMEPGLYGLASIVGKDWVGRATPSIPVESTTLDVILAAVGEIRLLKLDLEGAEAAALRGGAMAAKPRRCSDNLTFKSPK